MVSSRGWIALRRHGRLISPPRVDADGYVERYFQTSHKIYPVVERQSFMLRYDDFWLGLPTEGQGYELWVGILYMVLALGHQCSTVDPDPIVRRQALQCTDGEMCFLMARSTFADVPFCGGDLSAAISMFLGFIWLYNQQRFHESYAVLGAATRVGYAIGLHRQRILPESQEVTHVKTLWWCLLFMRLNLRHSLGVHVQYNRMRLMCNRFRSMYHPPTCSTSKP